MTLRLLWGVLVGALVLGAAAQAFAQGLNEVLVQRFSNNCQGLSGAGILNPFALNPDYGPKLRPLCGTDLFTPTGAAASNGGIIADTPVGSTADEQRIRRRAEERRAAASAHGDRGFGLFFTTDYERFEKDTTRFESGFDRDTVGGTLGVDYVLSPSVLLGLAVSYAHEFGDYDGIGGGFDHDSYGALLYTSLSPIPRAFVDLALGYVRKDYHFERRASINLPIAGSPSLLASGETRGNTESDELRFSVAGGYDFVFGNVTAGPRVGVHYRDTAIDAFRESGETGLELAYRNQNVVSLTTTAGVYASMAISTGFGVIVPQTTVAYVHEFLNDQRSVAFSLVDDLRRRRFLFETDPPDRDYLTVALGVALVMPGGITGFANVRELVGYRDRASHAISLGVRIAF